MATVNPPKPIPPSKKPMEEVLTGIKTPPVKRYRPEPPPRKP